MVNKVLCDILLPFQATSLSETATKSPVSGYKVSCFGNQCGQAFIVHAFLYSSGARPFAKSQQTRPYSQIATASTILNLA